MSITKESLIQARESVNEAILKIKQQYSAIASDKKILIVVEGKDDITYYGVKTTEYQSNGCKVCIIPAGNRKKVIDAYNNIDWDKYKKERILFIVDRDLSDFTAEFTPDDDNVYVTDKYAIENDLCCFRTFVNTLRYYCGLNDMDEYDENELLDFYNKACDDFYHITDPIMGMILYWKTNGIPANYANINCNSIFEVSAIGISIKETLREETTFLENICLQSQVKYDPSIIVNEFVETLKKRFPADAYTRGKYILSFFTGVLNYVAKNSSIILASKKTGKMTISIGPGDAISKLCAVMPIPKTLKDFLDKRVETLFAS